MLASYTFIPIFAPAITLYKATAKGLVAQLNSASDYGSEGYWFESSRGHNNKENPSKHWGFLIYTSFLPKNQHDKHPLKHKPIGHFYQKSISRFSSQNL